LELSWSTFLLEIVNFLILVWILKHFLYHPILDIVEKRRKSIEQTLTEAEKKQSDAEAIKQQYEGRLDEWESEKQKIKGDLQQEIQAKRKTLIEKLNTELEDEREKLHVIEQRRQLELAEMYQKKSLAQGAHFAAKVLKSVATQQLEGSLCELLLEQLGQISEEQKKELSKACKQQLEKIVVTSTFPLTDDQKKKLSASFEKLCERSIPFEYSQKKELIAGLRITLGSLVLGLNLQDELNGYAKLYINETGT
jgi:F-type H+-transporting ATPase subunit b